MRVRKLSPTGDMTFGNGLLDFWINVPEAVAQTVKTSYLLWLGEWYLDTSLGMPWVQGVLGKHNQDTADVTVLDYGLSIQGVADIQNFQSSSDQNPRLYTASFLLDTIYGITPVQIANQSLF